MNSTIRFVAVSAALMTAAISDARAQSRQGPQYPSCGVTGFYGGPLISHLRLYAVLWGPAVDPAVVNNVDAFYASLVSSPYSAWWGTDYSAGGASIFQGTYLGRLQITPINNSTALSDGDIKWELQGQIARAALPVPDNDTLFVIHFPPGVSITTTTGLNCRDWCGYHDNNGYPGGGSAAWTNYPGYSYAVVSDMSSCSSTLCRFQPALNSLDAATRIASHEIAEAVTDPAVGWYNAPGGGSGFLAWGYKEIADDCRTYQVYLPGTSYTVQQIWSRTQNACVTTANDVSNYGACCPNLRDCCNDGRYCQSSCLGVRCNQ